MVEACGDTGDVAAEPLGHVPDLAVEHPAVQRGTGTDRADVLAAHTHLLRAAQELRGRAHLHVVPHVLAPQVARLIDRARILLSHIHVQG